MHIMDQTDATSNKAAYRVDIKHNNPAIFKAGGSAFGHVLDYNMTYRVHAKGIPADVLPQACGRIAVFDKCAGNVTVVCGRRIAAAPTYELSVVHYTNQADATSNKDLICAGNLT